MSVQDVILVNEKDEVIGYKEKLQAHMDGDLHRAFSVLLFNKKGEMLIHQRAFDKYHSGGLWTNTCCSHPKAGEDIVSAGRRRLMEEMGIKAEVKHLYHFIYKAPFQNGLTEHELDHVLIGNFEGVPQPNPEEVATYRWVSKDILEEEIKAQPEQFTFWFKMILEEIEKNYSSIWESINYQS
ncbi:isopentenyl-diphosphate Delta-isomerase [Algivirga pacifica]|uniref:Isopentenyl-diphosphate delta-isomerase n=1 Tax=Algivirga pacifica TaxID=1162670 RepID=A0ABP9D2R0_9BACT